MEGKHIQAIEHPEGWIIQRIGDFAAVKGGKRLPAGTALTDRRTRHPYIRIVDFKDGLIDQSNLMFVPDDVFPRISRYTISSEDVWISIVGTVGLVGLVDEALDGANLTENAAKICSIASHVNKTFLALFLRSESGREQIRAQTVGSTQPKLALFRIDDIRVPIPPLPEQRRIAHVLGALDDKIENNRKTAKTLEAMAQAIFQSWFVDFDPVRAKMAGESRTSICKRLKLTPEILDLFPDRLVDSELGEIPEGWEVRSLDSIGNFLNGLAMQKFPPGGQDNPLPVIKIAQLRVCDLSGADLASSEIEPQFIVHDGDILFSWSGSLECVLWSGGIGALNQHLFKVTPKVGYPRWLCYYGVRHFLEFFREVAAGKATTMGHIQRHHLSDTRLALPHLKSLRGMNESVEVAFEIMWKELVEARKLSIIRDTLLPKLISGEIRVSDAHAVVDTTAGTSKSFHD